jgi:uncharacterized protein
MARTTYSAPSVYVEEIPSARQPIAGVGTNTVGFIGIVPDEIWCPVANRDYDPLLAQNLLDLKQLTAAGRPAAAPAPPEAQIEEEFSPPDPDLDVPSRARPYYLEKFTVQVAEFDTKLCTNFTEYADRFGGFSAFQETPENPGDPPSKWTFKPRYPGHHLLTHAVDGFFRNGGTRCFVARVKGAAGLETVLRRFESIEDVAILAAPGLPKNEAVWGPLEDYCENDAHQNVFAILDSRLLVENVQHALEVEPLDPDYPDRKMPRRSTHAAFYFPHIEVIDPAKLLQDSDLTRQVAPRYRGRTYVAPSGHVAGIYARTDEERGVHKAPTNATVRGAVGVKYYISRTKQELLNPQGVNCIRLMNGDVAVRGARTVGGDRNGEWKYVSVRRFAGFLEESISRGTQWVIFEPNDPSLWSRIILNVTAFLTLLWRNGALFGLTPQEAFYVKCDEELNPPEVRDLGQVIIEIGVAIVRPAEFVILRITQSTGPRQA